MNLDLTLPGTAMVKDHNSPFDYLAHAFFEGNLPGGGAQRPADCIVWANRGGGKTFLGAVATALELIHKPGIQVRILAGSLEQGARMHEHLRRIFERDNLKGEVKGRITDRRIALQNGSRVELLAQSQPSVRGVRPQRLRCDEVELFDPDVWSAAQLTTRSVTLHGRLIRGSIECLSTMHKPHGLMARLLAESKGRTVFKWGVTDVLEKCAPERDCDACTLLPECDRRAKTKDPGHITIDDAVTLKSRVGLEVWESEMMCQRPNRGDTVLPEFDRALHVVGQVPAAFDRIIAGMDFGFRSPTVFLWGGVKAGTLFIIDEHYQAGISLDQHIGAIRGSSNPPPDWVGADPAGNAPHEQTGFSDTQLLGRAGFAVRTRASKIQDGLRLIRARLRPADGSPARLFIHERCRRLIESLEMYHYGDDPAKEEPVKDGPDHAVDALRYMVLNLDSPFTSRNERYLP